MDTSYSKLHELSINDNNIEKIYKLWADTYEEEMKKYNLKSYISVYSKLVQYSEKLDDSIILDLGCGTGLLGEYIKTNNNNCTIYGCDLSEHMMNISRTKSIYYQLDKVDVMNGLSEIYNNKFDYIVSSGVFLKNHLNYSALSKISDHFSKYFITTIRKANYDEDEKMWKCEINKCNLRLIEVTLMPYYGDIEAYILVIGHN